MYCAYLSIFSAVSRQLVKCTQAAPFGRGGGLPALLLWGLLVLAVLPLLTGCGLLQGFGKKSAESEAGAAASAQGDALAGPVVAYATQLEIVDGPDWLKDKMRAASRLVQLEADPPDSLLELERRARADTETARKLLHSQGYYDGAASFALDENATPVRVSLVLSPGPRYVLGRADVVYEPAPLVPPSFRNRSRESGFWGTERVELPPPSFPADLPGVKTGTPVTAEEMLAAVEALPEQLQRQGYPAAKVSETRYTLNRAARELNAHIVLNPGAPALMGAVRVRGAEEVNPTYLNRLIPWQAGAEPWDVRQVEQYADALRATGLFRTVETASADSGGLGDTGSLGGHDAVRVLPVDVTMQEAPFRSISASARYDTDTGFGVEGVWEHRNLFGNGEKLVLLAPIASEIQGIKALFEKPAFLMPEQRLLASASALHQYTSAYEKTAAGASVGLERRLSRFWSASLEAFGESGELEDNQHGRQGYGVFSPRASIRRDSRDNLLNPSRGSEAVVKLAPFGGFYGQAFTVMAGSIAGNFYYAPFAPSGKDGHRLILAARLEAGGMAGAPLENIPSAMRYYAGGAGSVRGYAYQALGPRDHKNDPMGGRSYQIVNLEARFKITEHIGLVPFLDGGMVYRDEMPHIIGDMDWGAGLGLRWFTPVGPLRLDVAAPLRRISGDPPVQVYLSIGQSF